VPLQGVTERTVLTGLYLGPSVALFVRWLTTSNREGLMRVSRWSSVIALLLLAGCISSAFAAETKPIQVSLFNPVQIFPEGTSVSGVRLNMIYGKNANMTGLDYGLVNHVTGDGFAWQLGGLGYVEKDFTGWQDNVINVTMGEVNGVQSGAYNTGGAVHGVQFGFVNNATSMRGLQLGLLNMTETMHGLQIGVGNVIRKGKMPFLPIVNWSR